MCVECCWLKGDAGTMTSSPSLLPDELLIKLAKLCDICEHVRDISRKIAELQDDPLPGQLELSVPDYASVLTSHAAMLKRRHWMFIVAGWWSAARRNCLQW